MIKTELTSFRVKCDSIWMENVKMLFFFVHFGKNHREISSLTIFHGILHPFLVCTCLYECLELKERDGGVFIQAFALHLEISIFVTATTSNVVQLEKGHIASFVFFTYFCLE